MLAAAMARRLPSVRGRGAVGLMWANRRGAQSGYLEIRMKRGHIMAAPRSSQQTWRAAFTGSYDDAELDLLSRFIESDEWALDVGASLGFYTVPLAEYGRVVAVEPVAGNCRILERNLRLNHIGERVQIRSVALGATRRTMKMEVEADGVGNGVLTEGVSAADMMRHRRDGNLRHTQTVEVVPLDEVSELPVGRCAVMKLDVEGFELDVLAGATEFIAIHRPVIFGEFSHHWLLSRGRNAQELGEWAARNRYGLLGLQPARLNPFSDAYVLAPTRYSFGSTVLMIP